jgi:hypothetical protein
MTSPQNDRGGDVLFKQVLHFLKALHKQVGNDNCAHIYGEKPRCFFAKKKKQKLFNHYENTLFIFRNAKFNTPYKKGYYAIYSLER